MRHSRHEAHWDIHLRTLVRLHPLFFGLLLLHLLPQIGEIGRRFSRCLFLILRHR